MWKKIAMILTILLISLTSTVFAGEITNIRWSVHVDDKVNSRATRIVVDLSGPATVSNILNGNELKISIKNATPGKHSGLIPVKNNNVSKLISNQVGIDGTLLTMQLDKRKTQEDVNVFVLRKDPITGRPDRVVIDVFDKRPNTSNVLPTTKKISLLKNFGLNGKTIVIDPGHGGSDPGAIGPNKIMEKDITLAISKKLALLLQQKGANVRLTRVSDVDVFGKNATDAQELQARVQVGENSNADIFVSVHINASINRSVGGTSTYYSPKSELDTVLAKSIQDRLVEYSNLDNLGTRQAGFYVTKRSKMPAVLLELAFISNEREEKLLTSNWFQNKLATGISIGIEDYFKTIASGGGQ